MSSKNRMNGLKQLVRAEIVGNAAFQAIASDRVLTQSPRESDVAKLTFPLVVVGNLGGNARYGGALQDARLAILAYSQVSASEAHDLYQVVFDALHTARLIDLTTKTGGARANSVAGYAREVTRPTDGWDEALGAWYADGVWIVMSAG